MKFDFVQDEINFINANARFNDRQQEIFNRLTDKHRKAKSNKNCNGNVYKRKNSCKRNTKNKK